MSQGGPRLAVQQPGDELQSLVHDVTLLPRHLALLPKGRKSNLSIRNELSPISLEGELLCEYLDRGRLFQALATCPDALALSNVFLTLTDL